MSWDLWVAIAAGGAIGAAIRHLAASGSWGALTGVFIANITGAGLLGSIVAFAESLSPFWLALLATGLCGAVTTYSTLAVQVWELLHEDPRRAFGYLLLTTGAGGLAALLPLLVWGH
ncbi:MAG: CrcB family protein [Ornithinimicrobium sp.]